MNILKDFVDRFTRDLVAQEESTRVEALSALLQHMERHLRQLSLLLIVRSPECPEAARANDPSAARTVDELLAVVIPFAAKLRSEAERFHEEVKDENVPMLH
jgi:hypothetical protein